MKTRDGISQNTEVSGSIEAFNPGKNIKRLSDLILSVAALIILIPVFLIVIILILLEDGGHLFFVEEKSGLVVVLSKYINSEA